ncbi:ABC transporter permease [Pseudotabrizicola sp. 4114]|uniref:ABC transporter permease n=1 Tax=Pseudotabrizicola sp. 4114 TaxID=2817731 RepID=UPI0028574CAC|nr:ribose transport system permease protein [Pseudorhodobacter sp. 4114]
MKVRKNLPAVGEFGWIWIAFVLLVGACAVLAPSAIGLASVYSMLPFAAVLVLLAVGQTLVVQQRGLDMSVAAIVTLAGLLVAKFTAMTGSPLAGVVLTCGVCGAAGILNGLLVARIGISPIVATLATGAMFFGVARILSGGSAMAISPSLQALSQARLLGVPVLFYVAVVLVVSVSLILRMTIVGRRFIAVGSNIATARAQGTRTALYQVGSYGVAGVCYAIAGIALAGFIGYATPTAGSSYLLPSIAAVVVGGTPFTGGKGSVVATAGAALFMTLLDQMVLSLGAGPAMQLFAQAIAIIIAVSIRRLPEVAKLMGGKKRLT